MSDTRVTLRKEGTISIITMDDGKANVFAAAMAEQLHDCLNSIDPNEGAVIITGRPKFFSAGFDLKTIQGGDVQAGLEMRTKTINMTKQLKNCRVFTGNSRKYWMSTKKRELQRRKRG